MRRALAAAAVLVAAAAACSGDDGGASGDGAGGEGGAAASGELSVLSYNVAGLPQEISTVNPEEHIPLISPLLADYDIVLTQEDFDWWQGVAADLDFVNYHDRLRAEAPHEHATAPHPGPEAVGLDPTSRPLQIGDGLGVLSRLPFTGETRVPWPGCFGGIDPSDGGAADCLAMKGFAVVTVELADGAEVDVYTLHAEAGGTDEDQRLQADDFEQLAGFVADHSGGGGDPGRRHQPAHRRRAPRRRGRGRHRDLGGVPRGHRPDRRLRRDGLRRHRRHRQARLPQRRGRRPRGHRPRLPPERFTSPEGDDLSDHPPLAVELAWSASG